jgi:hypothetical protein
VKKIRIEPIFGSNGTKRVTFFDCVESLYLWLNSEKKEEDVPGMTVIELSGTDFLEVEWRGCEIAYEPDGSWQRYNLVRMAKAMPNKAQNSTGMLAQIYYGWLAETEVSFNDSADETSVTVKLNSPLEWKLDLAALFQDPEYGTPETAQAEERDTVTDVESLLNFDDDEEKDDEKDK